MLSRRKTVWLAATLALVLQMLAVPTVRSREAESEGPSISQATGLLNLAHDAYQRGQLAQAVQFIKQAHAAAPEDPRITEMHETIQIAARREAERQLFEGARLLELGDYKQASRIYQKALQLLPDDPRLHEQLKKALSEAKLRRIREGLSTVEEPRTEQRESEDAGGGGTGSGTAGSVRPTTIPSKALVDDTYQQGMRYLKLKAWFKAMQKFEEILAMDPYHEKARRMLFELEVNALTRDPYTKGREAFDKKQYETALGHFRQVETVQADFLDLSYLIGQCLEHLNDPGQAAVYYRQFLVKNPDHSECRMKFALLLYQTGNRSDALTQMSRVKHLDRKLFDKHLTGIYTWLYMSSYWFVYLLLVLEAALLFTIVMMILHFLRPLSEGEPHRLLRKAIKLYHKKKLDKATDLLCKAIVLKPNFLEAHFALGLVFSKMKRLTQAAERLKTVLFLDPDNQVARYNLALVYDAMKRHDQALIELRSIVSTTILRSIIKVEFREIKNDLHVYTYVFEKLKELAQQKIVSQKKLQATALRDAVWENAL